MTTNSNSWYIPGEGKKPAGPFTAEQIIQSWRAGGVKGGTLCWQEGMSQWLPLAQVEPFASVMRSAKAPPLPPVAAGGSSSAPLDTGNSSVMGRVVVGALTVLLVLVFVGAVGFIGHREGWWKTPSPHALDAQTDHAPDGEPGSRNSNRTTLAFDPQSIERTAHWASVEHRSMLNIGHDGNEIARNKALATARESFQTSMRSSIGQRVRWKLPVVRVNAQYVELKHTWPLEYCDNYIEPPKIIIEFGHEKGTDFFGHEGVVNRLRVGKDISLQRAEAMQIGEGFEVSGRVKDVTFYYHPWGGLLTVTFKLADGDASSDDSRETPTSREKEELRAMHERDASSDDSRETPTEVNQRGDGNVKPHSADEGQRARTPYSEHMRKGDVALEKRDFEAAVTAYQAAHRALPDDLDASSMLDAAKNHIGFRPIPFEETFSGVKVGLLPLNWYGEDTVGVFQTKNGPCLKNSGNGDKCVLTCPLLLKGDFEIEAIIAQQARSALMRLVGQGDTPDLQAASWGGRSGKFGIGRNTEQIGVNKQPFQAVIACTLCLRLARMRAVET